MLSELKESSINSSEVKYIPSTSGLVLLMLDGHFSLTESLSVEVLLLFFFGVMIPAKKSFGSKSGISVSAMSCFLERRMQIELL